MKVLRNIFLASIFFLSIVFLSFAIYPGIARFVHSINQAESSGYNTAGLYWSRPYQRFIPSDYETQAAIAFDFGIATLCVSGLFYGILVFAQRKTAKSNV